MALNLNHQTLAQFAERFWHELQVAFNNGDKIKASHLIWWIFNNITAGNFTNAQVLNSYNTYFKRSLNATQWTNLVNTRLIPMRDRYQAMLNENSV